MSDIRFTKSRNDNRIRHVNSIPLSPAADDTDGPTFSEIGNANQKSTKMPPWNLFITSKSSDGNTANKVEKLTTDVIVAVATKKDAVAVKNTADSVKRDEDYHTFEHPIKKDGKCNSKGASNSKTQIRHNNMFERLEHGKSIELHAMVETEMASDLTADEKITHCKPDDEFNSSDFNGDKMSNKNERSTKFGSLDSRIIKAVVTSGSAGNKLQSANTKASKVATVDNTHNVIRAVVAKCIETEELNKQKQSSAKGGTGSKNCSKREMGQLAVNKCDSNKRNGLYQNTSPVSDHSLYKPSVSLQDQNKLVQRGNYREANGLEMAYGQGKNKVKSQRKKANGQNRNISHEKLVDRKSVTKMTDENEGDDVFANATPRDVDISRHSLHTDIEDQALLRQRRRHGNKEQDATAITSQKTCLDKQRLLNDHLQKSHGCKDSNDSKEITDDCKRVPSSMKSLLTQENLISPESTRRGKDRTLGSKSGKCTSTLSPEDCREKSASHSTLVCLEKHPSTCTDQLSSFLTEISTPASSVSSYTLSPDPSPTTINFTELQHVTPSAITNNCTSHFFKHHCKEDKHNTSSFSTNANPNMTSSTDTQSCDEKSINKCVPIDSSNTVHASNHTNVKEKPIAASVIHPLERELTGMFVKIDTVKTNDTKQLETVSDLNETIIGSFKGSKKLPLSQCLSGIAERNESFSAISVNQTQEPVHLSFHVVTEAGRCEKIITQLECVSKSPAPCSERLHQHFFVTHTDNATLPNVEEVIVLSSPKMKRKRLHHTDLTPQQNETKEGHQNINPECSSKSRTEIETGNQHISISNNCFVPQVHTKDSYQSFNNGRSVIHATETKDGQLNSNPLTATPTPHCESLKAGQLDSNPLTATPTPHCESLKAGQLNSNPLSVTPTQLRESSKAGQLSSNPLSATPTELRESSKAGQLNSNPLSATPTQQRESSKAGQLNSNSLSAMTIPQHELKYGQLNSNPLSTAPSPKTETGEISSGLSFTTRQGETKPGQLNNNPSSFTTPTRDSKTGHQIIYNQCSAQKLLKQTTKDANDKTPPQVYRSYRGTWHTGSEQFHRKLPIKRSISSGALSLRDNASFFRRINDSYIYSNDVAYESDDSDDFGIDLDEMFKHLDTRRSRKPTRSYCSGTYSEKDIPESSSDELLTSTAVGKSKRQECSRTVRETVSCDRLKIRRCALADPLKMIMSQEDRERIERDVEKRRQSMVRKLSQFINIQLGLNKEEDLI